jgi:peptide methionine sulfoxide reductase msrA/msrB
MMTSMYRTLALLACAGAACAPAANADAPPAKPMGPAQAAAYPGQKEVAIVAGGCFWGMENVMRQAPGVISVEVGYAGGKKTDVSYEQVSEGDTGHAESVRITFDPTKISYEDLLVHWYFRGHDPTTVNRQNNDVGTQYRSEIFTTSDAQAKEAAEAKAIVEKSGKWGKPIVTKIEPATTFVVAEGYHQDYLIKNPHGYNDHYLRSFDF